jgi:hypothetical protein
VLPREKTVLEVTDSYGNTKAADSKEEVWISEALLEENIDFKFHFQIGSPGAIGSLVIDWVVFVAPTTALEYFGPHWHEGKLAEKDKFKLARLRDMFKRVVVWTELDIKSPVDARDMVKKEFKR